MLHTFLHPCFEVDGEINVKNGKLSKIYRAKELCYLLKKEIVQKKKVSGIYKK